MNRTECEEAVSNPGKFEGEAAYVPYFWDAYLDGMADDDVDGVLTFDVSADDVALFPELSGVKAVYLMEREDGFVVECDAPEDEEEETPENPTWTVEFVTDDPEESTFTVYRQCADGDGARVKAELQSIAGSTIESDGDFLYCLVSDPQEAREELESAGYPTTEGA